MLVSQRIWSGSDLFSLAQLVHFFFNLVDWSGCPALALCRSKTSSTHVSYEVWSSLGYPGFKLLVSFCPHGIMLSQDVLMQDYTASRTSVSAWDDWCVLATREKYISLCNATVSGTGSRPNQSTSLLTCPSKLLSPLK